MKKSILLLLSGFILSSCNILGESEIDGDFIFTMPQDGLLVWFDASRSENFALTGDTMDSWHPIISTGGDITCSASQPVFQWELLNGLGGLLFSSASPTCAAATHNGVAPYYTLFIVMSIHTASTISPFDTYTIDTSTNRMGHTNTCAASRSLTGTSVFTFRLEDSVYQDAHHNSEFQCSDGAPGAASPTSSTFANGVPAGIIIYELIYYDRWLEDYERKGVERYLMSRWGIGG